MHLDDVLVETFEDFLGFEPNHFNQFKVLRLFCSVMAALSLIVLLRVGATIFTETLEQGGLHGKFLYSTKYFIGTIDRFALILRSPAELSSTYSTEVKQDVLQLQRCRSHRFGIQLSG